MPSCDLCQEFTHDPTDCDWCGHRLTIHESVPDDVAELPPVESARERRPFISFAEAIAPVREARRREVSAVVQWAIAHGLPCDRNPVALCLEVLDRHRGPDGFELDRVDVNHVLTCDAGNWSAMKRAMRSDNVAPALWIVLHHLAEGGALSERCDPMSALLEPLQCYGGLGADGRERPEGVDVDFACQCFLPHDPNCPEGLAQHVVGHHRETFQPFIAHADMPPRSVDPPVSSLEPLFRLTRRVRAAGGVFVPRVEEFCYVGRIPPSKLHDEFWMYRLIPNARRGFDPLVLDQHGRVSAPRADRRRKVGYRWVAVKDWNAMHHCGVAARVMETDRRKSRWDDEVGLDDGLRAV